MNFQDLLSKISTFIKTPAAIIGLVVIAFLAGQMGSSESTMPATDMHMEDGHEMNDMQKAMQEATDEAADENIDFWTCSMHPGVHLDEAGQCPICRMDLIPVYAKTSGGGDASLTMSMAAMALADIETLPVMSGKASREVSLSGIIEYDETKLGHITAWVGGRIEKLHVEYTGVNVRAGDPLAELFSPELYTAQEELIQAVRRAAGEQSGIGHSAAVATLEATREKFRLLGFTGSQISAIEAQPKPAETMTISSPISGVVVGKEVTEGMYVGTGTMIYTIADLSRVWMVLDAYETDLPWLREGQAITFSAEARPGETFAGKIDLIEPTMDRASHTVRVRASINNRDGRFKPGMYVTASVSASLDRKGQPIDPASSGRRKLGRSMSSSNALLVPVTAVLKTGERSIVYVRTYIDDAPTFEGREITLGPRAGDHYIVLGGLEAGENVVVKGNFKIDSAMQIAAKPSMMGQGEHVAQGHAGMDMGN